MKKLQINKFFKEKTYFEGGFVGILWLIDAGGIFNSFFGGGIGFWIVFTLPFGGAMFGWMFDGGGG